MIISPASVFAAGRGLKGRNVSIVAPPPTPVTATIGVGRDFETLNEAALDRFPLQQDETWICYGGSNLVNNRVDMETWNGFDLHIEAAPGHEYTYGEFDPAKAHIKDNGASYSFNGVLEPRNQQGGTLFVKGLQTWNTLNATGNAVFKPYDNEYNVGVKIIADNCYFRGIRGEGPDDMARRHRVLATANVERGSEIILRNCVLDGFQSTYVTVYNRGAGIHTFGNGPPFPIAFAVHCTFVRCDWGVTTYTYEVAVQSNLAAFNNYGGFANYQDGASPGLWAAGCNDNISDDASIPDGDGNLANQTVNFVDFANTDLRPADASLNLGVDLTNYDYGEGKPLQVTTDLLGNPRTVWTAGAYEYLG